jgi:adenosylcobinamide-GDP ribazoletransferase
VKGFIIALQFLTRLPMPAIVVDDAAFARSMRWFPAVGLVIGAAVAGAAWAGALVDHRLGALAALVVWVGVTGALHLDGLSDLADASGAVHKAKGGDRERLLAVIADPHVGSFGVIAIVLQLLSKLMLLHMLIDARVLGPLILVPFAARIGPLVWTWWLMPLHQGLAARFRSAIGPVDLLGWAAALAAASWFYPALLVTPLLVLWWGWHVHRTIGGISGDGHGAGVELIETGLLLSLVMTVAWGHGA